MAKPQTVAVADVAARIDSNWVENGFYSKPQSGFVFALVRARRATWANRGFYSRSSVTGLVGPLSCFQNT